MKWCLLFILTLAFSDTYLLVPFYNELDVLRLHLDELGDVVDHIVIHESIETFTGQPKPLYFDENKELFAPYLDKIIHVKSMEKQQGVVSPWEREWYQRDQLMRGASGASDDDLILLADADEIVSKESLIKAANELEPFEAIVFRLKHYNYFMNLYAHNAWLGPVLVRFELFKRFMPRRARLLRLSDHPNLLRRPDAVADADLPVWMQSIGFRRRIIFGGWHFSYMGGLHKAHEKMQAISHAYDEDMLEKIADPKGALKSTISSSKIVDIDASFPSSLRENSEHWEKRGFILRK